MRPRLTRVMLHLDKPLSSVARVRGARLKVERPRMPGDWSYQRTPRFAWNHMSRSARVAMDEWLASR